MSRAIPPGDAAKLLAHELESPILSLEIRLRSLLEEDRLAERVRACLDEVSSIRSLLRDVLLLTHTEIRVRSFPLAPVLDSLVRRFGPIASHRRVELEIPSSELEARGDAGATERILGNLLANAIEASTPGSPVTVRARAGAGRVVVEVEDRGPGIEEGYRERIFEPFFRLDRERPGSGLGLTLARRLAEAQDARLAVWSEPGNGSRFSLSLEAP